MEKRLGIIVPYRNRRKHLEEYVTYMGTYLKNTRHKIYVIEQQDGKPFNRGKLLNVGYKVSKSNSDYVCFHDVDLLPENVDYSRKVDGVKLLAVYREHNNYVPKRELGGVILFNNMAFEAINGYSNNYWAWGAEDSDLRYRCESGNILIERDFKGGRYKSLFHELNGDGKVGGLSEESKRNRNRYKYLVDNHKYEDGLTTQSDGLNTLKYKIVEYVNDSACEYYGVEI